MKPANKIFDRRVAGELKSLKGAVIRDEELAKTGWVEEKSTNEAEADI